MYFIESIVVETLHKSPRTSKIGSGVEYGLQKMSYNSNLNENL